MKRRPPFVADLVPGQVIAIAEGPLAGTEGVVERVEGGEVRARVTLYGRTGVVTLQRDQVERPEADPRPRLAAEIERDVDEALEAALLEFWLERSGDGRDLLADWEVFVAHRARAQLLWREERTSRLQAFLDIYSDQALAMEGPLALLRRWAAERARWVPEAVKRQERRQLTQAQADELGGLEGQRRLAEALEAEALLAQAASDRWQAAEYLAFRKTSLPPPDALQQQREAGRREAEALRTTLTAHLEPHGVVLPDAFFAFWAFFRGLAPAERDAFDERLGGRLTGWLARLEETGELPAGSPRQLNRQYRDPPELLPVLTLFGDEVRVGLWFDEPRQRPTFAARYAPNDPMPELAPSGTTLLEALRYELESTLARVPDDRVTAEDRTERLGLALIRDALCELETADRPERGAPYLRRHEVLPAGRLGTVHGLGVLVPEAGEVPRRNVDAIREAISDDGPEVRVWSQLALEACARGRPADALALGQDLWWLSDHHPDREALATRLLEAAYGRLGRTELLAVARAPRR